MTYRRLGRSGIQVSTLSFGSWVTFNTQLDKDAALSCMQAAWEAGVNFFDNAEAYDGGESERVMGDALAELGWPRHSYVLSTKFFFGIHESVNSKMTLNRKYLLEAIDPSLERLGVDHLDIAYCHRHDPDTPMEEIVWAMSDIVSAGKAHYWGTSEWSAQALREACEVADAHHLHRPVVEQPEYNLINRQKVEHDYVPLYEDYGIGLTTWSPLKSGLLSGKYLDGIPEGSRGALPAYDWLGDTLTNAEANARVQKLVPIAAELDCTLAQLAIAWCAANPNVSTVITGASRASQVTENMVAMEVLERLDDEMLARIDAAFG